MLSPPSMVVFQPIRHGGLPPLVVSSSIQSEMSTGSVPVLVIMIYWSEKEPMSPSPFQSVPLYWADDADTNISSMTIPPFSSVSLIAVIGKSAVTKIKATSILRM